MLKQILQKTGRDFLSSKLLTVVLCLMLLLLLLLFFFPDFYPGEKRQAFVHPGFRQPVLYMETPRFAKFRQQQRGDDVYYLSGSAEGIICSVTLQKISLPQAYQLGIMGPQSDPRLLFKHYSRSFPTDYQVRRQSIGEFAMEEVSHHQQRHIYLYARLAYELLAEIHISKQSCSPADSLAMKQMLQSLEIKRE